MRIFFVRPDIRLSIVFFLHWGECATIETRVTIEWNQVNIFCTNTFYSRVSYNRFTIAWSNIADGIIRYVVQWPRRAPIVWPAGSVTREMPCTQYSQHYDRCKSDIDSYAFGIKDYIALNTVSVTKQRCKSDINPYAFGIYIIPYCLLYDDTWSTRMYGPPPKMTIWNIVIVHTFYISWMLSLNIRNRYSREIL